jgi:hypothetical protein
VIDMVTVFYSAGSLCFLAGTLLNWWIHRA